MNSLSRESVYRIASLTARAAPKAALDLLHFLRQTLLYAALFLVAAMVWFGIAQPQWLVDDGPQDCAAYAPQARDAYPSHAVANTFKARQAQTMNALNAGLDAENAKIYAQCQAHNAALTDTTPLTRASYERLVAREDAEGWVDVRFYMIVVLLVGVIGASLESAILHEIAIRNTDGHGFVVRTDRRMSGPRVIDDLSYPSVYRSNRP